MEFLLLMLLMALWMGICVLCVIAGIILGIKRQKEYKPEPMSKEQIRKKEQAEREFQNFLAYNGDSQSR